MNELQKFLLDNPVEHLEKDIIISKRLEKMTFKIRPMTGSEYQKYQNMCVMFPDNPKKRSFNTSKFNSLIVTNHTVEPNFKDAEWLESAKIADKDPMKLVSKVLLAGEIDKLSTEILKLSGFGEDMDELVEDVKNS